MCVLPLATVEACRALPHGQLDFMEHHTSSQRGRCPDVGLTPARGGPFRASQVIRQVDARTSGLAEVRERGDVTRRFSSPVSSDHGAIAGVP
jgi:hypothetical protein